MTPAKPRTPRKIARAEGVGSLIRSQAIANQMDAVFADRTTSSRALVMPERAPEIGELNRLADEAIGDLVKRQIDAGLDVVTDGEVRRATFLSSVYDAVDNANEAESRYELLNDAGEVIYSGLGDPVFSERLHKGTSPISEEIAFLRGTVDYPFKVTVPAPSYFFSNIITVPTGNGFDTRQDFAADALEVTKLVVADAIASGARWIQFDFPLYPSLVDGPSQEWFESIGETAETLLDKAIAADSAVLAGIPDDVTVALHLCRGNLEGGIWNGSLTPIAERMFNELPHDRFLFEWEDVDREGDYEPIKYVPKGKTMVMGIVSTKRPELESDDEIKAQLEEAAKFLDIDQLALSPQCGFASLYGDHLVSAEDAQWRKLELVGRVADDVWGQS
jgi:5-methyltetrahydropteroyltriglutamate--homocysteine methyltransferase